MYTNLRFSNRSLEQSPQRKRAYMSLSPINTRNRLAAPNGGLSYERPKPNPYDFQEDKLFIKSHDLRNPFLSSYEDVQQPSFRSPPVQAKSFVLPRRHADHGRVYTQPPDNIFEAIFEIFATRFNSHSSRPIASGVLISHSMALTTHSSIPTIDAALRCHLQFVSNGEFYKFSPRSHFATHSSLNLTLVAVEPINKTVRQGIRLRHAFYLQEMSRVYWGSGSSGTIEQIDKAGFYFYSAESMLQGTAIFDYNWEFVGLTLTSVSNVRFNEARRADLIYNFANSNGTGSPIIASKAEKVLSYRGYRTIGLQPIYTDVVHWFLWGGRAVMTFDMTTQTWKTSIVTQTEQMVEFSWCFLPNTRVAILPDQTLILAGGTIGSEGSNIVMRYYPFQETISPCPPMLNARHAAAVVYLDEYVYAIGGTRQGKSAERYSLTRDFWQYILPTNYERFEAAAVAHEKFVFVVGGSANEAAGQTIERYSSFTGEWEVLRILLPSPLINPGLCALSNSRIAILGGRGTRRVYVLQNSHSQAFSLQEATTFPDEVETVYPVVYFQTHRQLLIFNSSEHKDRPVLIKYAENCFSSGEFMYLE